MKKKFPVMKGKSLWIQPATDEEILFLKEKCTDAETKQAYDEIYELTTKASDKERFWVSSWKVVLNENNEIIGDVGFKAFPKDGSVEVGYQIFEEYRNKGYVTEALELLIKWAYMNNNGLVMIEAEAAEENAASRKVLEKLNFQQEGMGEEGLLYYYIQKPVEPIAIYLCLGVSIGTSFGVLFDNLAFGVSMGMLFGLAVGSSLKAIYRKQRIDAIEKRRVRRNIAD